MEKPFAQARATPELMVFVLFLGAVFLLGGGSREDIQSLIILRPLSVIALGYGLWTLDPVSSRIYRPLSWFFFALAAALTFQLVPLPPTLWHELPGRDIIAAIDRASGIEPQWRPISMVPEATVNALFALVVPAAAGVLFAKVPRTDQPRLTGILLIIILASAVLGLVQIIGSDQSPAYLYRVTNRGSAVGLFSNRNHQALLLASAFPLFAIWACTVASVDTLKRRGIFALIGCAFIVPMVLVTGSRAGFVIGALGVPATLILYRRLQSLTPARRRSKMAGVWPYILAVTIIVLVWIAAVSSRAVSVRRLMSMGSEDELRFQIWGPIWELAWKYFPFGSGFGSFVPVWQVHEPDQLLASVYVNHVHNDWLEVVLTGGVIGLGLLVVAVSAWALMTYRIFSSPASPNPGQQLGRLGSVLLFMFGLSSVGDYPLRTPSLSALAVVMTMWLFAAARSSRAYLDKPVADARSSALAGASSRG